MRRHALYRLLGVSRNADDAAIRSAYRRAALARHPDKGGQAVEFLEAVEAFEILSDRVRRATYDEELLRAGSVDGLDNPQPRQSDDTPGVAREDAAPPKRTTSSASQEEKAQQEAAEKRTAALWRDLLVTICPSGAGGHSAATDGKNAVAGLSCRATETLLAYARSEACCGSTTIAATNAPIVSYVGDGEGNPDTTPTTAAPEHVFGNEHCGKDLLADAISSDYNAALSAQQGATLMVVPESVRSRAGEEPASKRQRVTTNGRPGKSRAWICLGHFKVCTRTSQSFDEALGWHIMLVHMKQVFHSRTKDGEAFDAALKTAVAEAVDGRTVEGASDRNPKLRYVTEYATTSGVLFTPTSQDLDAALRHRAEIEKLRAADAGHQEVLAAIKRMSLATEAAVEDQKRLVDLLNQHLRMFRKCFRWHGNRPPGVNAAFFKMPGRIGSTADSGSARTAFAYAEVWRMDQLASGAEEPLCRGPRRTRVDEAVKDAESIRAAQESGGDKAARAEARRLYEAAMFG